MAYADDVEILVIGLLPSLVSKIMEGALLKLTKQCGPRKKRSKTLYGQD